MPRTSPISRTAASSGRWRTHPVTPPSPWGPQKWNMVEINPCFFLKGFTVYSRKICTRKPLLGCLTEDASVCLTLNYSSSMFCPGILKRRVTFRLWRGLSPLALRGYQKAGIWTATITRYALCCAAPPPYLNLYRILTQPFLVLSSVDRPGLAAPVQAHLYPRRIQEIHS